MSTGLAISDLSRRFDGFAALGPLDLMVEDGSILAVLGRSGCGKSTLLRLLAGLDRPSAGQITIGGAAVDAPRDDVAVVFQEPRLMPWLTVAENVGFGLWQHKAAARRPLVEAALQRVGLGRFAGALPKVLSGGMAQRVAVARALVTRPRVLLLDEPFAALDPLTRMTQQDHLLEILGRERPTVVLVTHDVDEALVLGDRVIILDGPPGRVRVDRAVDLPRPRRRTGPAFQALKAALLEELGEPEPAALSA